MKTSNIPLSAYNLQSRIRVEWNTPSVVKNIIDSFQTNKENQASGLSLCLSLFSKYHLNFLCSLQSSSRTSLCESHPKCKNALVGSLLDTIHSQYLRALDSVLYCFQPHPPSPVNNNNAMLSDMSQ